MMSNRSGFLWLYQIYYVAFVGVAGFRVQSACCNINFINTSAFTAAYPFDHSGVEILPALHKQCLLGKLVFGIEHQNFGFGLVLFEVIGNQTNAFVCSWWTAERILRCCDNHYTTVG